jgi:hypothetical protein
LRVTTISALNSNPHSSSQKIPSPDLCPNNPTSPTSPTHPQSQFDLSLVVPNTFNSSPPSANNHTHDLNPKPNATPNPDHNLNPSQSQVPDDSKHNIPQKRKSPNEELNQYPKKPKHSTPRQSVRISDQVELYHNQVIEKTREKNCTAALNVLSHTKKSNGHSSEAATSNNSVPNSEEGFDKPPPTR